MGAGICLEAMPEISAEALTAGSAALTPAGDIAAVRFSISARDPEGLEALRHARRSMLREEWTLGREPDEPSLEDVVFTATEVSWRGPRSQQEWCLRKLEELLSRANRTLAQLKSA